ncbi:unnamed protein product [Leptidea sinapis]|uniref:Uncharacterized protein n=1 Tax=Leptidea sinapis TaxID=189913 RepID=A0A5E4QVL7_9NEOP|nr:unnamed protein product [Leptidea sinapis]
MKNNILIPQKYLIVETRQMLTVAEAPAIPEIDTALLQASITTKRKVLETKRCTSDTVAHKSIVTILPHRSVPLINMHTINQIKQKCMLWPCIFPQYLLT